MSWILLLSVLILWMCRSVTPGFHGGYLGAREGSVLFAGGLLLIVLFMGLWSRVLTRRIRGDNLHLSLQRFHKSMMAARIAIPVWFGIAIFVLGWGNVVAHLLRPLDKWPVELPGLILGTLPAMLAWMGLWWAQYPADRALREQSVLIQLDENLPIHAPPRFWSYFTSNLRLQLLFTVVPVILILFIRDVAAMVLWKWTNIDLGNVNPGPKEANVELILSIVSVGLVVLFAPEVLRRVLHTEPLEPSPLRERLEELCRRTGLKYRNILRWKTNNNMGNAAVMGLIWPVRYVLLSDVLLETMTDAQIEAVFAHEIGHVKHWHMGWYVVLIATLQLLCFGPGQFISDHLNNPRWLTWLTPDLISGLSAAACIGGFFMLFGYLSRWFERQADVFAARIMEQEAGGVLVAPVNPDNAAAVFEASGWTPPRSSHVGPHGAATFASALHRVAIINNIPISARNFTHGSIAQRMQYLKTLSTDPTRTIQFDRTMSVLYAVMMLALLVCGVWVMLTWAA